MKQPQKSHYQDLTQGKVAKRLILYSLPYLITTLCQAFANITDLMIIGIKGEDASISGVGTGAQLYILILALAIGLGLGGTVVVGQNYGKGKKDIQKLTDNMFFIFLAVAIFITVVVTALHNPLLRLLRTPQEAFPAARVFTLLSAAGIPFLFIFNGQIAILRGAGDSKRPMYIAVIALAVNAALDALFVLVLNLKEAGVALASVISHALSTVIAHLFIKKSGISIKPFSFSPDKEEIKKIMAVAIPGAIQNSVAALSFLLITGFVNSIGKGEAVYASAAGIIVTKYNNFAILPSRALSMAISAMIAQNVGKGEYKRVKKTFIYGSLITFAFGIVFAAFTLIAGKGIFAMFNCDGRTLRMGLPYLRVLSIDYLILPFATSLYGLVNGYGKTNITMLTAILTSLVLRVPLAYLLGIYFDLGLFGIGCAMPISTLFSALFIAITVLAKRKSFKLKAQ